MLDRSELAHHGEAPNRTVEVPLVPSRPPIRVEEGLIEVGWEGSLDGESAEPLEGEPELAAAESSIDEGNLPSEEMVEDHYAALQAWTEWARNRGRGASAEPGNDHAPGAIAAHARTSESEPAPLAELQRPAGLRVESQHEHAPYSQLFTRLRQSS